MYFQPFKSSVRITELFFKGINENSGDKKEKRRVEKEIFVYVYQTKL
jgi:hypothetical protein